MMILLRFLFIALVPLSAVHASEDMPSILCDGDKKSQLLFHPITEELTYLPKNSHEPAKIELYIYDFSSFIGRVFDILAFQEVSGSEYQATINTVPIDSAEPNLRAWALNANTNRESGAEYEWILTLEYPDSPLETVYMLCHPASRDHSISF